MPGSRDGRLQSKASRAFDRNEFFRLDLAVHALSGCRGQPQLRPNFAQHWKSFTAGIKAFKRAYGEYQEALRSGFIEEFRDDLLRGTIEQIAAVEGILVMLTDCAGEPYAQSSLNIVKEGVQAALALLLTSELLTSTCHVEE